MQSFKIKQSKFWWVLWTQFIDVLLKIILISKKFYNSTNTSLHSQRRHPKFKSYSPQLLVYQKINQQKLSTYKRGKKNKHKWNK